MTVAPLIDAQATEPDTSWIEVTVAKTNSKVIVYGDVGGPRPGQRLVLTLRQTRSDGDTQVVERKRVRVVEGPGYSFTYRATFERPSEGTCDVRVRFRGNDDHTAARAGQQFPCFIPPFGRGEAVLDSGSAATTIDALIADNDESRGYGLMYRPKLALDKGMIFTWNEDIHAGFYMKNTLIPLSIAFFDANGVVQEVLDMEPCSEDSCPTYTPAQPFRGALEVNQGMFTDWDIAPGDTITFTSDSSEV